MIKEISWHSLSLKDISIRLKADFKHGLNEKEVERRKNKFGKNAFETEKKFHYLKLLWKQIKSPLVFILIIAGIIALALEEYTNTIVIFLAVVINTVVGMIQEGKASQAFDKLKSSQVKYATVVRGGQQKIIKAEELVPGDIIILKMGDIIPADARLIDEKGIEANESILTGEWITVSKDINIKLEDKTRITDRDNMVWMGTLIIEGWAKAVVVNTGFNTEIGKIAEIVKGDDVVITPLQKGIKKLARFLTIIIILVLIAVFFLGILRGESFVDMLLISVAIAVATIPAGLPVAITVVLAIGMKRILSKGGLVKNLNAVETLGSTNIILTDKTGTITKAKMQVSKILTLLSESREYKEKEHKDRLQVLQMAIFGTEAFIENPEEELKEWIIRGNPISKALFTSAIESGLNPNDLLKKYPRIDFIPFDSERRFAASLHKIDDGSRIYMTGAPELLLSFCDKVYKGGKEAELTNRELKILKSHYEKESSYGTRIIGVAYKNGKWDSFPHNKKNKKYKIFEKMVFAGFIGFHDPIREDVFEAIKNTKRAMVRPIMVTGDHIATAKKVAEEVGLLEKNGLVLSGKETEKMSDEELKKAIEKTDVFARVLPHQKLRIIKALQSSGNVVAMTGDGVNDAPALKNADIGLALGSGTEVAKEASDIILLNNSFSIIVSAIEEGRKILDNFKKIIAYLLSTTFTEVVLAAVAIFAGMPLPFLPAQILWTNIIEEGFMNFAFAFEPKEKDLMSRNPKDHSPHNIITKNLKKLIFSVSVITSVLLLIIFFTMNYLNYDIEKIRTIIFAGLSIDALFFAFSMKNLKKPIWKINLLSNHYLIFALIISIILLVGALTLAPLQKLLTLTPLSINEFLFILGIGIFNLFTIETAKHFLFFKENKKSA